MDPTIEPQPRQLTQSRTQEPPLADLRRTRLGNIDRRRAAQVTHAESRHQINAASFGSTI